MRTHKGVEGKQVDCGSGTIPWGESPVSSVIEAQRELWPRGPPTMEYILFFRMRPETHYTLSRTNGFPSTG